MISRLVTFLISLGACASLPGASHTITTFAGTGDPGFSTNASARLQTRLNNPFGLTRGPDGDLYFCDTGNHAVRRIHSSGTITTIAGDGTPGYSGDGGPANQARLREPYEIRFHQSGDLFIVERLNHTVRRVAARTGLISTIAGTGQAGFSGDGGPATRAQLNQPHSIQFDRHGTLYICDIANHRIRIINTGGTISTLAGNGRNAQPTDASTFTNAPLPGPRAIDFDAAGQLWLALREGNAIYRLDLRKGTLHHVAGTGKSGFTGNGGPARDATLSGPKGIAVGPDNSIYFADTESHSIRRLDLKKETIELVAGTGTRGSGPDGDALQCRLNRPHGIHVDADGTLFVGDSEAHVIRRIAVQK